MQIKRTLLVTGVVGAVALMAPRADAVGFRPLIVIDPGGTVRIEQALPCGDRLDTTRRVAGGRIDVTPMVIAGGAQPITMLYLSRVDVFVSPFSVSRECAGIEATAEFFEIGFRLASAVTVRGDAAGPDQMRFTIPKNQFLIYTSNLDNLPVTQPDRMYKKPSEDVTGVIDLRARTVEINVALASRVLFRAGCVGSRCAIDQILPGTQTANVRGTILVEGADRDADGVADLTDNCPRVPNRTQSPIATPILTAPPDVTLRSCRDHNIGAAQARDVCHARPVVVTNDAPATFAVGRNVVTWRANDGIDPIVTARQTVTIDLVDTTPPSVSCTAVPSQPGRFQAAAMDDCGGGLTLRLGGYRLDNGEVVQIQETRTPGVRLIGTVGGNIRSFEVGPGEGVIRATDAAGNVGGAACR